MKFRNNEDSNESSPRPSTDDENDQASQIVSPSALKKTDEQLRAAILDESETSQSKKYKTKGLLGHSGLLKDYNDAQAGLVLRYQSSAERKNYKVEVINGRLHWQNGHLDTAEHDNDYLFVMDGNGNIFVAPDTEVHHHSWFLSGAPVAASGHIGVRQGEITSISDVSGHYALPLEYTEQFLAELRSLNVNLDNVSLSLEGRPEKQVVKQEKNMLGYESKRLKSGKPSNLPVEAWLTSMKYAEASNPPRTHKGNLFEQAVAGAISGVANLKKRAFSEAWSQDQLKVVTETMQQIPGLEKVGSQWIQQVARNNQDVIGLPIGYSEDGAIFVLKPPGATIRGRSSRPRITMIPATRHDLEMNEIRRRVEASLGGLRAGANPFDRSLMQTIHTSSFMREKKGKKRTLS